MACPARPLRLPRQPESNSKVTGARTLGAPPGDPGMGQHRRKRQRLSLGFAPSSCKKTGARAPAECRSPNRFAADYRWSGYAPRWTAPPASPEWRIPGITTPPALRLPRLAPFGRPPRLDLHPTILACRIVPEAAPLPLFRQRAQAALHRVAVKVTQLLDELLVIA